MATTKQIAKRTAHFAVKLVEVFYRIYLYFFHLIIGSFVCFLLSMLTKREFFDWFDKIVNGFIDWSEDRMEDIDEWFSDNKQL
jgi:hypothetical protein